MANRRKQGQRTLMPHSIEAEMSVIGAVLLRPSVITELLDLRPSQFFHPLHGALWRLILELHNSGARVDQVALGNRCEADESTWALLRTATAGHAASLGYFSDLMNACVTVENLGYHVRIIQDHAYRRLMAELAGRISQAALDQDSDVERLVEELESLAAHTEGAKRKVEPYETEDLAKCRWPEPTRWVIDPWIPVRNILEAQCCLLVGEPKSQKSFLLTDLAIALAYGGEWLGMRVRGGNRVLLYNAEDSSDMTKERYGRLCLGRGFDPGAAGAPGETSMLPGHDEMIRHAKRPGTWDFMERKGRDRFVALCRVFRPSFVLCDPLVNLIGDVDENKAGEMMARFLGPMRELSQELGFTLILAHHVSKPSQTKQSAAGSIFNQMRGTSALRGWSSAHAYVEVLAYETPKLLKVHFEQKHGAGRAPQTFMLEEPDGVGKGPCRFALISDADGGQARVISGTAKLVAAAQAAIRQLLGTASFSILALPKALMVALGAHGATYRIGVVKTAVQGLLDEREVKLEQREIGGQLQTCYVLATQKSAAQ